MFSSALKSFSSNIASNYTISTDIAFESGAWKVYDARKKSTNKAVSIFVFDRKILDNGSGNLSRGSGGPSLKRLHDSVIARIKKEATSLARLRHPSILELAEPIEDTRSGGLIFATEPIQASLAFALQQKDRQEQDRKISDVSGRGRSVGGITGASKREVDINELEIQKGFLQIAQGLEFLHDSAGLVHGNLTPEAIFINAKSDWKIGGFAFAGPVETTDSQSSMLPLSLSEALYHEPRLPRCIQLDLDYTSPDFALDSNISPGADMFSLGLLLVTLYNSPHQSPIKSNTNLSTYKKILTSSATIPSTANNFLSSKPLPSDLKTAVLPRLLTRRPAQRMNAREFQQSAFFDNILVSALRFLDALPAKNPSEKSQFLRGLPQILDQFPKSVLEKKILPALLEETKDQELLALILQNAFHIVRLLPSGRDVMASRILPQIRDHFTASAKVSPTERNTAKEAGLVMVIEHMALIGEQCSSKDFKDYMLPVVIYGMESTTMAIVDKSLGCVPIAMTILDFSCIKNQLFPVIASVFSKTSSLAIKVRGLQAFMILCGGTNDGGAPDDDLNGFVADAKVESRSAILDKYTIQEKIVPLLKAMKTKEPVVMMAALDVFRQVGRISDPDFLAMEVLPILWSFSLGPLLNLQQFRGFMELIRSISNRIEQDQIKKLTEINSTTSQVMGAQSKKSDLMSMGPLRGSTPASNGNVVNDFEQLVLGSSGSSQNMNLDLASADTLSGISIPSMNKDSGYQTSNGIHGQSGFKPMQPIPSRTTSSSHIPSTQETTIPNAWTPNMIQPLQKQTQAPNSTFAPNSNMGGFPSLQPSQPSASPQSWPVIAPQQSTTNFYNAPMQPQSKPAQTSFPTFNIMPPPGNSPGMAMSQHQNAHHGAVNPGARGAGPKKGLDAYESLI